MAFPDNYFTTYTSYKAATTKIATWLVDNARRCGADLDFLSNTAGAGKGKPKMISPLRHQVPPWELPILAKTIVLTTNPKIAVPKHIITLIRAVIDMRVNAPKLLARFSKSQKDTVAVVLITQDDFIIGIMLTILKILRPDSAKESPIHGSNDMFAALSAEEAISEGTAVPEYEIEVFRSDQTFAIIAFLKDMRAIRIRLIVQHDEAQRFRPCRDLAFEFTYTAMLAVLTKCLGSPESPADDLTDDFTGWAGMNIFTLLMEIHEDLVKKPSRTIKPGYLGRYDAAQDRKKMCKHEQDMEDEIVVLELLPEFLKLSKARVPIPAQDELTAGLRKMMDAGKIDALPLYVVFASQAFLDIHHILREETIRPFQEIQETAKRVIDTVDAHFEFLHETMGGSWNDANLLRVRKFAKGWIQKDIIGPRFETEYKMKGVHQRSFFLLKIRPVLCGLWTYRMNTLLQECGMNHCNTWRSVTYTAHLYNAVRHSVGLESQWKDMDCIISLHSPQRIFGGAPPTNTNEYLKRFLLAIRECPTSNCARKRHDLLQEWWSFLERYFLTGGPVSSPESNPKRRKDSKQEESQQGKSPLEESKRRVSKKTKRKRRSHGLKTTTPVKNVFYQRYVEHGSVNLSTANIAKMLAVAIKAERTSTPVVDLQALAKKKLYNPLQLLDIVREGVAAEESHLVFDYFGFHERS